MAVLAIGAVCVSAQTVGTYNFYVVPQYNAAQLHKEWTPVLERVSQISGVKLTLKLATSIPRFEAEFMTGRADFCYMNPYHAVMAYQAHGYVPLLRDSKPLTGVLVVRKTGPYQTLSQLNGQHVAFPAPNSFGASLYMRALLAQELGVAITPRYVTTHSNVLRLVARDEVAAGGSVNAALQDEEQGLRDQLKVLYTTPATASHPVAAHPRVPQAVRDAVAQAFISLGSTEQGAAMLQEVRTPHPVLADFNRDYSGLKKLRLEKFMVIEKDAGLP